MERIINPEVATPLLTDATRAPVQIPDLRHVQKWLAIEVNKITFKLIHSYQRERYWIFDLFVTDVSIHFFDDSKFVHTMAKCTWWENASTVLTAVTRACVTMTGPTRARRSPVCPVSKRSVNAHVQVWIWFDKLKKY